MSATTPEPVRWAIVTGGASGIGRAIAWRLASQNWHVAVVDCDLAGAEQVVAEITQAGHSAEAHPLDVAHSVQWEQLVRQLRSQWPRLDLVVNAAGNLVVGHVADVAADDMARLVEVNLLGTMYGCRAALPWLIESAAQGAASGAGLLNIASIFAHVSPPGFATYNATKAGIVAWTETLRGELAPAGLNATVVLPGVTPTPLFARASYPSPAWRGMCSQYLKSAELTADQVAAAAIAGIYRRQHYVVVGRRAKLYARLKRIAPAWLIDRVGRLANRQLHSVAVPPATDTTTNILRPTPLPRSATTETR